MQTIILLFQCEDQKGIVAKVSDFIFRHDGNIITADQYSTDPEGGHFFLRMEFYNDETCCKKEALEEELIPLKEEFGATVHLFIKEHKMKMGILVSRPDHCLVDLLYLARSGELAVDVPFVISNCEEHKDIVAQYGIPFHCIPATKGDRREEALLALVKDATDFLVLAR